MISTSGSRCAATANASRTYIPLEYRLTGVSMNFPIPLNSTISSNFALISRRFMPRIAPFRYVFSRPVSSGMEARADLEDAPDAAADRARSPRSAA